VRLALEHLKGLGHQEIAFFRGQPFSSDSATRWAAIEEVSRELGIRIRPELVVQIEGTDTSPSLGYPVGKELLDRHVPFTAVFAYNDISAIGSIWAFRDAGLRIPEDISVVGFDDIPGAAFNPGLSTVRQPLIRMGQIAAQTVVNRIEKRGEFAHEIAIEPVFVARASTGPVALCSVKQGLPESQPLPINSV
jgi:DNA-binding LacI/PurR family transcriptional regulator